jgi:catechol 2,3-dioxygenase-like lactoylglutathione lyase family enzyme
MKASVEFYTETLGLALVNQYGDHYAEIQAPGLMIALHPTSDKVNFGNNLSIGFGVLDFDLTIAHLETKGIEFIIEKDGWIRLAHFTDPDGNSLYLAENKKAHTSN